MTSSTAPLIILTKHAVERAQQRGVVLDAITCTAMYGTSERATGGVVRRTISRTAVKQLTLLGFPASEVGRYQGTVIITRDLPPGERLGVTVCPTEKRGKKRVRRRRPIHSSSKTEPESIEVPDPPFPNSESDYKLPPQACDLKPSWYMNEAIATQDLITQ